MDPMLRGAEALATLHEIARTPHHMRQIGGDKAQDILDMVELYRMAATQAPLKVERAGNITGKLPCGHPVSDIVNDETNIEPPYCAACFNK